MSEPVTILVGDVREQLRTLPDGAARCCVTSPPYWGLRDYGHPGQLGLEATPEAYVAAMVEVFREVRRVLADDGTLWVNVGDSYARNGGDGPGGGNRELMHLEGKQRRNCEAPPGLKPKDLVGIPWRLAFALQADGWYLRQDIIWHKPNPMPESVQDRCTKAHEYVFLLTKSASYFYDQDAVRVPYAAATMAQAGSDYGGRATKDYRDVQNPSDVKRRVIESMARNGGANLRTVWTIPTQPYSGAHFATFPEELPERCIRAGSAIGDTVLDPFLGSGTTIAVARKLGRRGVGIEINPEYAALARDRIGKAERPHTHVSESGDVPELFGGVA